MDYDQMKTLISGNPSVVKSWINSCEESKNKQQNWINKLRKNGIKAAHPDDGWVDRINNKIHFCYPHFNDGAKVGDLIVLGWHFNEKKQRVVKIIREENQLLQYFYFEEVKMVL